MAYQSNILLGLITKTSGFEGAVIIKLEKKFIDNITPMESVFLEVEGRPVPFFISEYEYSGSDILKVSFQGYDSIEEVNEFKSCRVFLTSGVSESHEQPDIQKFTGYSVYSQDESHIGTVTAIITNPGQWLLSILSPTGKEILIPFHEDLILKINNRRKTIIMEIPEGLIDIN